MRNQCARISVMKLLITLIALMLSSVVSAEPLYKVELIAFEHITAANLATESWPLHPVLPNLARSINLRSDQTDQSLGPYQLLPRSQLTLQREQYALRKRGGYHILLHVAWLQPARKPWQVKPVHLYAKSLNARSSDHAIYNEPIYDPLQKFMLNGTVRISRSNYIDVKTDLVLNVPKQQLIQADPLQFKQWPASRTVASFSLRERRRMRPNEIHYLDHPLFGLLIKVTPQSS